MEKDSVLSSIQSREVVKWRLWIPSRAKHDLRKVDHELGTLSSFSNINQKKISRVCSKIAPGLLTEVEYIQGYLVRKARELKLAVSATTFCYRVLKLHEKGPVNTS